MSISTFPYDTRLNILHAPLELVDIDAAAGRQGFVAPKGIVHRTRAPERTVILMVENAGIVPTGDE